MTKMILQITGTILVTAYGFSFLCYIWIPKDLEINKLNFFNPFKERKFGTKVVGDKNADYQYQVLYTKDNWASNKSVLFHRYGFTWNKNDKEECLKVCRTLSSWEEAEQYSVDSKIKAKEEQATKPAPNKKLRGNYIKMPNK